MAQDTANPAPALPATVPDRDRRAETTAPARRDRTPPRNGAPQSDRALPARAAAAPGMGGHGAGTASFGTGGGAAHLTGRQKAAVIVRLLLAEGQRLPLTSLPEELQTDLTEQVAALRLIDRATLDAVVREFLQTMDQVGLAFTDGLHGALAALGDQISESASERLRRMAAQAEGANPWTVLEDAPPAALAELLQAESPQVGAVVLSRLSTGKAAAVLTELPGEAARAAALAMPHTETVAPQVVDRIGHALARQIAARPPRAFAEEPDRRMGAILDATPAALRDEVLSGIEAQNAAFAQGVRRAIFTYADIPDRLPPLEVPRLVRVLDPEVLQMAMAGTLNAGDGPDTAASEFLLRNMSQRMAANLRDDAAARGKMSARATDEATAAVVATLRALVREGEITLAETEGR